MEFQLIVDVFVCDLHLFFFEMITTLFNSNTFFFWCESITSFFCKLNSDVLLVLIK